MTKVVVTGSAGRMGSRIIALLREDGALQLAGATEREGHPAIGKDVGEMAGVGFLGIPILGDLSEVIEDCEVVIDFTLPAASVRHAEIASASACGT